MSAKQLDDNDIVMGKMVRVANQQKKFNENEVYIAIHIENEDGDEECCLLFTEIELSDMEKIHFNFALERMKAGRLYSALIDGKKTFFVKFINDNDEAKIFRLSPSQLKTAVARANRNPEDLPKKSWWTDLKD